MNALQQYSILNQIGASQQQRQQQLMEFMLNYKLRQQELEAGQDLKAEQLKKLQYENDPVKRAADEAYQAAQKKSLESATKKYEDESTRERAYQTAMEQFGETNRPTSDVEDQAISAMGPASETNGVTPLYGEGGSEEQASKFGQIMQAYEQEKSKRKQNLYRFTKEIGRDFGAETASSLFGMSSKDPTTKYEYQYKIMDYMKAHPDTNYQDAYDAVVLGDRPAGYERAIAPDGSVYFTLKDPSKANDSRPLMMKGPQLEGYEKSTMAGQSALYKALANEREAEKAGNMADAKLYRQEAQRIATGVDAQVPVQIWNPRAKAVETRWLPIGTAMSQGFAKTAPDPLPPAVQDDLKGSFNMLGMLRTIKPYVQEGKTEGVAGWMGKLKQLGSNLGVPIEDSEWATFDAAMGQAKANFQTLVKGTPSNMDIRNMEAAWVRYIGSKASNKAKINLAEDITKEGIKLTIASYASSNKLVPSYLLQLAKSNGINVDDISENDYIGQDGVVDGTLIGRRLRQKYKNDPESQRMIDTTFAPVQGSATYKLFGE